MNTGGQTQEGGEVAQLRVVVNWTEEFRARRVAPFL